MRNPTEDIQKRACAIRELLRSAVASGFLPETSESEVISLLSALEVNLTGLADSERKSQLLPTNVSSLARHDQYLQGLTTCVTRAEQLWQRLQEQASPTDLTDMLIPQAPQETPKAQRARELSRKPSLSPAEFYEMATAVGEVRREITESETVAAVKNNLIKMEPNLFDELRRREQEFRAFLDLDQTTDRDERFLLVLKRWNSYSPILSSSGNPSMGGGYFLCWNGKGIVIDPGISYIRNMIECGLRFADIDAVFMTHAHIDHCADFEPLLTLLYEYNKDRGAQEKHLDVFMNLGALRKFSGWVPMRNPNLHLHALESDSIRRLASVYGLDVQITPAKHDEILSSEYAVGLIFNLGEDCHIGITGDTGWDPALSEYYLGCKVFLPHIGSIKVQEFSKPGYFYPNHLGIRGLTAMLEIIAPEIALISEFGEEFSGALRVQVTKAIASVMHRRVRRDMCCLPADVGLRIRLTDFRIQVLDDAGREKWVPASDVRAQVASDDRDRVEYRCFGADS
jgi:hypothetical protein